MPPEPDDEPDDGHPWLMILKCFLALALGMLLIVGAALARSELHQPAIRACHASGGEYQCLHFTCMCTRRGTR